jgi:hypothetical protein
MSKRRFVETAPLYYALAICVVASATGGTFTRQVFSSRYYVSDEEGSEPLYYCDRDALFTHAIDWLRRRDMVDVIEDDFAPPIFTTGSGFVEMWQRLSAEEGTVFQKYNEARGDPGWLNHALQSIEHTYVALGITEQDFKEPDSEWEPIPLDRDDPKLGAAIRAVDATIEQVRIDNGYTATLPEERKYVLDGLNAVSKTLREAVSVSAPYIRKYAFEPLIALVRRFGPSALGLAAAIAKEAILEWLKKYMSLL